MLRVTNQQEVFKMKKKIIAAFGVLSVAGVIGFTVFQSGIVNAEPKLSKEEIRKQVTAQYPGKINELELESENNISVYEVEVELDGKEYELKIHADTGEVLKLEEKTIPTKVVAENENVVADPKTEETAVNNSDDDDQDEKTTKSVATKHTVISNTEAKRIAMDNFDGTIVEIKLDNDDNRHIYEIELVNGNRKAEIEIDAYTGKVIVLEIETDDDGSDDNDGNDGNDD